MISVEQAQELVFGNLPEPKTEVVPFRAALGRVLSDSLAATCNVPPFRRSAMDGYAVRSTDALNAPVELEIAGEIRAGTGTSAGCRPGRAISVMTGAPVPDDADAVQIVENTTRSPDGRKVIILKPVRQGENITPLGSEAALGEIVLESGRPVGPAELAVMATFGFKEVKVWKRPAVALLTTGDELVDAHEEPLPGQIRNSNAYSVGAQLRLMGIDGQYFGIARDDKRDLRDHMSRTLQCDVIILTGGVSMGEYDFVKEILTEFGFKILFSRVALKPGKPTVFARKENKLAFGLPGNPVSTFISFENFVRPALGRLCGLASPELPRVRGILLEEMKQPPGRAAFLPARVRWEYDGWKIKPLRWKGSADIVGFSRANAAVIFPADRELMRQGDPAEAMLLPDFFLRLQTDR